MVIYERYGSTNLFESTSIDADYGWAAYYAVKNLDTDVRQLTLLQAYNHLCGFFVFAAEPPSDSEKAIQDIHERLKHSCSNNRGGILWITDMNRIDDSNTTFMGWYKDLMGDKLKTTSFNVGFSSELKFASGGSNLSFIQSEERFLLKYNDFNLFKVGFFSFFDSFDSNQATIDFTGPYRGCIRFKLCINQTKLNKYFHPGFQITWKTQTGEKTGLYPLFSLWERDAEYPFDASINPSMIYAGASPLVCPTELGFANAAQVVSSTFRTSNGNEVSLRPLPGGEIPSRFTFTVDGRSTDRSKKFILSPDGDFSMSVASESPSFNLMGGLFGVESIHARENDILRFSQGYPGYVTQEPADPGVRSIMEEPRMNDEVLTSWATVLAFSPSLDPAPTLEVRYRGQPDGQIIYGKDTIVHPGSPLLLGANDPGYSLPRDCEPFPLLPYSGVKHGTTPTEFSYGDYRDIESSVLLRIRRRTVTAAQTKQWIARNVGYSVELYGVGTTPSGCIAEWNDIGKWLRVQIAQSKPLNDGYIPFDIESPALAFQQALQTKVLFMVASDYLSIGKPDSTDPADPKFNNSIYVENWAFQCNVGNNRGSFANVMIIKGCRGKLTDFVANPGLWTMPDVFSSNAANLSQWLIDELANVNAQTDPSFDRLKSIMQDETWTGRLLLHVDINQIPPEIAGLMCGIKKESFYVHHIILDNTPIEQDHSTIKLHQAEDCSMFGLIYYVAPHEDSTSSVYKFNVQKLVIAFEGSEVIRFEVFSDLTMNLCFGERLESGSPNTVRLEGSRKLVDGLPRYQLVLKEEGILQLQNSVIGRFHFTSAELVSDMPDQHSISIDHVTEIRCRILIAGYIDFNVLKKESSTNPDGWETFDLFCYGNATPGASGNTGLRIMELTIAMTCTADGTYYRFDASRVLPDASSSISRAKSLLSGLSLTFDGFISGEKAISPLEQLGYLPIDTELSIGNEATEWYGLRFQLHLGTLGALFGKPDLKASLIVVWKPNSESAPATSRNVAVGISIPGLSTDRLLPLQGFMKLALSEFGLSFESPDGTSLVGEKQFLLRIPKPSLELFGLSFSAPSEEKETSLHIYGVPNMQDKLAWFAIHGKAGVSHE